MKLLININKMLYEVIKHEVKVKHKWDFIPCNIIAEGEPCDITISKLSDSIAYEVDNLVTYIIIDSDGKPSITSIIIHNETELCIFIDIFGDAVIVSVESDLNDNAIIGIIYFKHLTKEELLLKENEYLRRAYL